MSETNKLMGQILDYLFEHGVYAWRQNSGGIFDRKLGVVRSSTKKGVPDIIGFTSEGKFVGIEVKTGKDRLRPEQIGFLHSLGKAQGISMLVSDYDNFVAAWNSLYSA